MEITMDPTEAQEVTGLPNPLLQEMERPYLEAREERLKKYGEWHKSQTQKIYNAALEPDEWMKTVKIPMPLDPDPKASFQKGVVASYLQVQNRGKEIPGGPVGYRMFMERIDQERFAGRAKGDEKAFFGEIAREALETKTHAEVLRAIQHRAAASVVSLVDNPFDGEIRTFDDFDREMQQLPNYNKSRRADYLDAWNEQRQRVVESVSPFAHELAKTWRAMKNNEVGAVAQEIYAGLSDDERPRFMEAIGLLSQSLPKEQKPAFWANLAKQTPRDMRGLIDSTVQGALGSLAGQVQKNLEETKSHAWASESQKEAVQETFEGIQKDISGRREALNFSYQLQKVQDRYDPSTPAENWIPDDFEKGLYSSPSVIAYVGMVVIPVVGPMVSYQTAKGSAYSSLRDKFESSGLPVQEAGERADEISPAVGAGVAILDYFGAKAFKGAFPFAEKAMTQLTNRLSSIPGRIAARSGIIAAEELAIERAQDFLEPAGQALAKAAGKPVPGVVWKNGEDGVFDGFWAQNWQTLGALAPLAMFGGAGGISSDRRALAWNRATDTQLLAILGSREAVAKYREAATRGLTSAASTMDEVLRDANPRSDEARAAVAALQGQAEKAEEDQAAGLVPRFVPSSEGIAVVNPDTGEIIGTGANSEEAIQIASSYSSAVASMNGDRVAYLASLLESGEAVAQLDTDGGRTVQEFSPGESRTAAQEAAASPESYTRVMAQLQAEERMGGGNGALSQVVVGSSETEFREGVRQTVNRLYAGASTLDVVHERTHAWFRSALEKGAITREEAIRVLRGYDQILAGRKARDGEALQFLPEGDVSEVQLDEAVSKFMEAEVLRTRPKGRSDQRQVIPSMVTTRNLTALARIAGPEAARKWSAFAAAVRKFFGVAFERAVTIRKAMKEGQIDSAEHEAFVSRLMGLESQDAHNAKVMENAAEIAGPSFSLRPGMLADAVIGQALQQARNPQEKGKILDRVVDLMNKVKLLSVSGPLYSTESYSGTRHAQDSMELEDRRDKVLEAHDDRLVEIDQEADAYLQEHRAKVLEKYGPEEEWEPAIRRSVNKDLKTSQRTAEGKRERGMASSKKKRDRALSEINLREKNMKLAMEGQRKKSLEAHDERLVEIDRASEIYMQDRRAKALERWGPEEEWTSETRKAVRDDLKAGKAIAEKKKTRDITAAERKRDRALSEIDLKERDARIALEEQRKKATGAHEERLAEINQEAEDYLKEHGEAIVAKYGPEKEWAPKTRKAFRDDLKAGKVIADKKRARDIASAERKRDRALSEIDLREKDLDTKAALSDQRQETLNALATLDTLLAALPSELRGKVGGYTRLASLRTDKARVKYFQDRLAKMEEVIEGWLQKQYGSLMSRLLKRAVLARDEAGKTRKGKADNDTHRLFEVVKETIGFRGKKGLSDQKAEAKALALEVEVQQGIANGMSPEEQALLTTMAQAARLVGGWRKRWDITRDANGKEISRTLLSPGADAQRRAQAFSTLEALWNKGYAKRRLEVLLQAEDREIMRKALEAQTGKTGSEAERTARQQRDKKVWSGSMSRLLNFSSFSQMMDYFFGEDSKESQSFVDRERQAANQKEDGIQDANDRMQKFLSQLAGGDLKAEKLQYALTIDPTIRITGKWQGLNMTPVAAIHATMMWRQPDGRRHMEGTPSTSWSYDQSFIDQIEAQLTPEAIALRDFLTAEYAAEYARLNPVYRRIYGVDMPKNALYSPITVTPQQSSQSNQSSATNGTPTVSPSATPGAIRSRSAMAVAQPRFDDALQTWIAHNMQMQHWMAYAELSNDANAILGNTELRNKVEALGGVHALDSMNTWLESFSAGGFRDSQAQLVFTKDIKAMLGRATSMALVGRFSTLAIQSLQLAAAVVEVPAGAYARGMGKLLGGVFGGAKMWREAIKSDFVQRRIRQMPPAARQAMESLSSSSPNMVKFYVRKMGLLISGADGLFTAGTYAIIYDHAYKQGKSMGKSDAEAKAYAHAEAERKTEKVAQPTRAGTRSIYENSTTSVSGRIAWSFASEARQKLALLVWALAGKRSLAYKTKVLGLVWGVGGMGAAILRAAVRDMRDDGEDEEVFDERNWDPKRLLLAALTGPFAGVPFIGDMIESATYAATGTYMPGGDLFSSAAKAPKSVGRLADMTIGDEEADAATILKDVEAILTAMGLFNETLSAYSSLSHVARDAYSVGSNFTGD